MREFLTGVSVFRGIPPEGLAQLAGQGRVRTYQAGSQIMRQGELSDSMHVILAGRVRVELTHPQVREPTVLAELGPGEPIGEMGVLDNEPRSATVTAINYTETVEIPAEAIAQALQRHPEVANALLRVLSRRLRNVDELAAELRGRASGGNAPAP